MNSSLIQMSNSDLKRVAAAGSNLTLRAEALFILTERAKAAVK